MFPDIASSISLSLGLEFSASKTAALMICPDWQYPHCGTSISIQACCSGCVRSGEIPSIVVTFFPSARETGATQERTACPSICTVHAPHSAMPQPYFVPVRFNESRITHSKGVDGGSSTVTGLPLTVNEIKERLLPRKILCEGLDVLKPRCDATKYALTERTLQQTRASVRA